MHYDFSEIFDDSALQDTCNAFTRYSGMTTAVIDLNGIVHAAAGWQEICTRFHRANAQCAARCLESDTALANQTQKGQRFNLYHCKNGLVDAAIPIRVQEKHIGNFFTGQFLLRDPDIIFFERQAHTHKFDRDEYLNAVGKVPVFTEQEVEHNLMYLVELAELLGRMGLERCISRERVRAEQRKLEKIVADRTRDLRRANSKLLSLNNELENKANTDALTGVHNRAAFDQRITSEWKRGQRGGSNLALLFVDIDCFKQFNDYYGHPAGDRCLSTVAAIVEATMERSTDFVARYGGEEFVCLLPDTDRDGAAVVANRIQRALHEAPIEHEASPVAPQVTVSIGLACARPAADTGAATLIDRADRQLYAAKANGRNRVFAEPAPISSTDASATKHRESNSTQREVHAAPLVCPETITSRGPQTTKVH